MNTCCPYLCAILLASSAAVLPAAFTDTLKEQQTAVKAEIALLQTCLTNPPVSIPKTFRVKSVEYTIVGRDDSGLFCSLSNRRSALVPWDKLPSRILVQYKPDLARQRLSLLMGKVKTISAAYEEALKRVEQGYVYADGVWVISNEVATAQDQAALDEALKKEWGDDVADFAVFNVQFGMTPAQVQDIWPEAKRALTDDGYFTLELDRPAENLHLTAFFDESRHVIMIMVLFENMTTTKRDSIIEALDEKYTRKSARTDENDTNSVDYTYNPGEKIILVVKTRRFPMGHSVVCTYGHIDKYREHEARQKEKMKEALKSVL